MKIVYFNRLWTVCLLDGSPVPPFDDPQGLTEDQGMFFQSPTDAEIAAQHQRDLYDVECEVRRVHVKENPVLDNYEDEEDEVDDEYV